MKKEFIPYELAVKLKELGFDEPCLCSWNFYTNELNFNGQPSTFSSKDVIQLPTFSQALRWFREKHNLYHKIDKQGYWFFEIKKDEGFGDLTEVIVSYDYNYYEKAELACLDKLIEIVESKDK